MHDSVRAGEPPTTPVTLADVARHAGLSLATTSRVLSGAQVRPESRRRVEASADELGYRTNLAAQAVARGYTRSIVVIVDHLREPRGAAIAGGVVSAASRSGFVGTIISADSAANVTDLVRQARTTSPRGLVWAVAERLDASTNRAVAAELGAFARLGGRVVVAEAVATLPFPLVETGEAAAAEAVARLAQERRASRALVLRTPRTAVVAELVVRALHALGIEPVLLESPDAHSTLRDTGFAAVTGADPALVVGCDVILAGDDALAVGVIAALRGMPGAPAIDVLSIGGLAVATDVRPALTTIDVGFGRTGERAAEAILDVTA